MQKNYNFDMMTPAPTGGASGATQMFSTSKINIIISIFLDMIQNLNLKGQRKGRSDDL